MVNSDPDSTKLKIELCYRSSLMESPTELNTVMEADLTHKNVHAWFSVFANVLLQAGFSEKVIMSGAAQLAFNEWRSIEDMRQVAEEYDLVLQEDLGSLKDQEEESDD